MKSTDFAPRSGFIDTLIKPGMTGIEIGVDVGSHAEALLRLGVSHLTLVDIWDKEFYRGYCAGRLSRWQNKITMVWGDALGVPLFHADFIYLDILPHQNKEAIIRWIGYCKFLAVRSYSLSKKEIDELVKKFNYKFDVDSYHNEIIIYANTYRDNSEVHR